MKAFKFLSLLLVFGAIIGFIFAMFWDIPRPVQTVEKPVSLDIRDMQAAKKNTSGSKEPIRVSQ